jgi:hypothetical protein
MDNTVLSVGKINKLNYELIESFHHLSPDTISYDSKFSNIPFISRYRGLHCLKYDNNELMPDEDHCYLFAQQRKFHNFYEAKLPQLIKNNILLQIGKIFQHIITSSPLIKKSAWIGINQIRMISKDGIEGYVAPTFHQDGYHQSIHICVNRHGVEGGVSMISTTKDENNIALKKILMPGEYIHFDDQKFYHTATPIRNDSQDSIGYRDMVIIDILYF